MIRLEGTRFGTLEFSTEDIVHFEDGMIGFVSLTQYVLVPVKEGSAFSWLQSVENAGIAFLIADPNRFVQDYLPEISDGDAAKLKLSETSEHVVFVTTNIPAGRPNDATINLAAPVVINVDEHLGKQVILNSDQLPMRHSICTPTTDRQKVAA